MPARRAFRPPALAAFALLLPALAACQAGRETTGSIFPADYRDRHPIALTNAARILDLFVEGPTGLTARSQKDLAALMAEYRRHGQGTLVAQVPVGTENAAGTRQALAQVREAAGGRIGQETYRPADPTIASPIRVSFKRLQAQVTTQCGLWPEDLGVGDYEWHSANRQWYNFGCAHQANFAAQVADPVDLVRGRQETPPDISRRMYNIGQIRQGQDPSTQWRGVGQTNSVAQALSQ